MECCTNQAIAYAKELHYVTTKYMFYFMTMIRPELISKGKGGTQKNISQAVLKSLYVPVPPIGEQQHIVSRIEELSSNLDEAVQTLQETKQQLAVYRRAVITAQYPELNSENKVCLADIADITGGITKGRKLQGPDLIELPYLRVANVQNGYLDLSVMKNIELKADEKDRYLLHYGDVLYTEGGDRDKLGRGTVWRCEIPDCVHQNHVFRARLDADRAIPEYIAYWSMGGPARNYFYQKGKQTVNLASINKTVLSALPIPLPSKEEQRRVVEQIESRLSVCDSIEKTVDSSLAQAESLRQSIMKKAFEGSLV